MARNVPFVMTTFVTMDFLKSRRLHATKREGSELTLAENLLVGVSSALVAGLLTNPVDVVKTRMMTQAASTQLPYTSAFDCLKTSVTTEGALTCDDVTVSFEDSSVVLSTDARGCHMCTRMFLPCS